MMADKLSEEQQQKIAENRRKALALRAKKQQQAQHDVNFNSAQSKVAPANQSVGRGPSVQNGLGYASSLSSHGGNIQANCATNKNHFGGTIGSNFVNNANQTSASGKQTFQPISTGGCGTASTPTNFSGAKAGPQKNSVTSGSSYSSNTSFYNSNKSTTKPPAPSFVRTAPTSQSHHQQSSCPNNDSLTSAQRRQGLYTTSEALQRVLNSPSKLNERKRKARVTGKCVLQTRQRFEVLTTYHAGLIEVFKSIGSKLYDSKTRQWSFDLKDYETLMRQVLAIDEVFIDPLPKFVVQCFKQRVQGRDQVTQVPEADLSQVDEKLVSSLMTFQRQGVNFGIWKKGRILLADDMGLGKTIQAICLACYYRKEWPVLVVVPSSVRFSWREQFLRWVPSLDPQSINVVVSGKDNCTSGKINIVSYDIMARCHEVLQEKYFKVVIMDESHSLKNFKTARTKAAGPILKRAQRVILLSGTPALSRPSEIFPQISAVDWKLFPNFREFGIRYCNGKEMPWGWDFSGSSNLEELQIVLEENVMIRRLKKDVLAELPSKRREMVILDPSSVKKNKNMTSSHKLVDKLKGMDRRGALLEYFHETSNAKIKAVTEYVLDLLENDHKFLLFAHHQDMMEAIEQAVVSKKYRHIRIDGKTSSEDRKNYCDWFQTCKDVKIAILSITAANAGLNLTASSLVVFAELFWNPGILVQAEDRVHRLGQENAVLIRYLVGTGTADDYIWPMVQKKLDILGKAGLSKDDFSDADTTTLRDPKQNDIMSYFEESFFEDDMEADALDGTPEKQNEVKTEPTHSKPSPSTSFGSPRRKTPGKSKLTPSRGQTTLHKFFSPTKSPETSPQKDSKGDAKRTLFPSDKLPVDEEAAKELESVMKMSEDDLFCDFDEDDFGPSVAKKAKLS